MAQQTSSLATVLDAQGHLLPDAGGSYSAAGFQMIYAENGVPRFIPAEAVMADQWSTNFGGANGLNGNVSAIAISDSDVYVGGNFSNAGGNPNADGIARWDGTTWNALGIGINNFVFAIAISGNDIYVGGLFNNAGGNLNADNIARWDGTSWNALGTGLNNTVSALAISGNDVYAAGQFTDAGGNGNADRIARWDGFSWHPLGSGACCGGVSEIAVSGSDVYIGGIFTDVGGDPNADDLARWDGSTWHAVGTNDCCQFVSAIAVSGSDLYVAGGFVNVGGDPNADFIVRWDGAAWNALGTGLNSSTNTIATSGSNVYVGGNFTNAGGDPNADDLARWDGSAWSALGAGLDNLVDAIAIGATNVWAGGRFNATGNGATASLRIGSYEDSLLPVELTAFNAVLDGQDALLTWTTASETNNAGFEIQQRLGTDNTSDGAWTALGWLTGKGTTEEAQSYGFRVEDLAPSSHTFRLKQIDYDGSFDYSPEVEVAIDLPEAFLFTTPYPNPFTDRLQFSLMVKRAQQVHVGLYNVLGQQVATFYRGMLAAETARSFAVSLSGLSAGQYVLRAEGEYFVTTRPVTRVR